MSTQIETHVLPALLRAIPAEWCGTTFNNSALLGREGFTARLDALLARLGDGDAIAVTEEDLANY